ncbi:beta-ketoacyl synthase, partial [Pelagophyceae sp. CCMP2097]
LAQANIGVFLGIEPNGGTTSSLSKANVYSASGAAMSVASGRLSFTLGLIGPCFSIDTACASTLAAMHVASISLRDGECPSALCMGTKFLTEISNLATSIAGMTSARGRCHTFDERADGYVRGEGCGAFLL